MRLKIFILCLFISVSSFAQDSLITEPILKEQHTATKKSKKKFKKKRLKATKTNSDTAFISNNYQSFTREESQKSSSIVLPVLGIFTIIVVLILVFKEKESGGIHDFYKDKYLRSFGWNQSDLTSEKREELLRQFESESGTSRQKYYRQVYLKSDEWKRKRFVVLKRDNWRCVHCGSRATQVHHKRYAPINIGREPIEWLESVCKKCHDNLHL
jgi:hypothetical protein